MSKMVDEVTGEEYDCPHDNTDIRSVEVDVMEEVSGTGGRQAPTGTAWQDEEFCLDCPAYKGQDNIWVEDWQQ